MIKLIPSRLIALATLAAVTVGLAAPALAMSPSRDGAERGDLVFVPDDTNCIGRRAGCETARYY